MQIREYSKALSYTASRCTDYEFAPQDKIQIPQEVYTPAQHLLQPSNTPLLKNLKY